MGISVFLCLPLSLSLPLSLPLVMV
jgi:hypothetical protein